MILLRSGVAYIHGFAIKQGVTAVSRCGTKRCNAFRLILPYKVTIIKKIYLFETVIKNRSNQFICILKIM